MRQIFLLASRVADEGTRRREVKQRAQGHTAGQRQSQDAAGRPSLLAAVLPAHAHSPTERELRVELTSPLMASRAPSLPPHAKLAAPVSREVLPTRMKLGRVFVCPKPGSARCVLLRRLFIQTHPVSSRHALLLNLALPLLMAL